MAGEPNPIRSGNYTTQVDAQGHVSAQGDLSMELALATKMQLILDQPESDIATGLVNRDFEGDFFKIGDSVAIVKPDLSSLAIEFGSIGTGADTGVNGRGGQDGYDGATGFSNKDARLRPGQISFEKNILTIDKFAKYAFAISDITKAEGKWNYESGNLDATAAEMRKDHNLQTVQMIIDDQTVGRLGSSPANPIVCANGDALYAVIVKMFGKLYNNGAITADGQVTYGSNAQQGKQTFGKLYVPTDAYTELLLSKYLQDRSTVAADEKVATGKVKTVMGLDIAIEPSLDATSDVRRKVVIDQSAAAPDTKIVALVAGTRNLVTRAGKVLPPEKLRSQKYFADEYHGMEIYAEKVVEPKAGIVAFVQIPA